jgi:uncharacterized damage-inducible protein DinB
MFRKIVGTFALASLLVLPAVSALAQESGTAQAAGVKGEMLFWIHDARDKLIELAGAMPEEKYGWRPAEGVRTTAEVFMHVAGANFGLPFFTGVKPPEGFDFRTFEGSATAKADVTKKLTESFAYVDQVYAAVTDADMDRPVELFGTKTTVRGTYMLILAHCHEHLGQAIAYARSNGVVPPWTARQEAAMKEAQGK